LEHATTIVAQPINECMQAIITQLDEGYNHVENAKGDWEKVCVICNAGTIGKPTVPALHITHALYAYDL
jgi:hypothetical protein